MGGVVGNMKCIDSVGDVVVESSKQSESGGV
jgi:hypothetical protein